MSSETRPADFGNLIWMLSRPPIGVQMALIESPAVAAPDDEELAGRVAGAYQRACAAHTGAEDFWNTWSGTIKKVVHDALLTGGATAREMLRHPERSTHFWGFDAVSLAPPGEVEPHENVFRSVGGPSDWKKSYALWLHDTLINLAEGVGATRVHYPETEPGLHYRIHGEPADVDTVLDRIEEVIGIPFRFPNPFEGEVGLDTRRGVAGFRSLQALYQAWRVRQVVQGRPGARVLEIGAGLGRTAYYAHQLGIRDYTILDIPLTGAAQGYFLGKTLGPDAVSLLGEEAARWQVKVLPPESLSDLVGRFDLVLNVDSFTEMAPAAAQAYWDFASARSDYLLSINHELNQNTFKNIHQAHKGALVGRHPYWMRRGYVEELIDFRT